jgi:hypothetical protein
VYFSNRNTKEDKIRKGITIILVGLMKLFVSPIFFMLVWNYVMPYLFQLPTINYLHSMSIVIMLSIIQDSLHISKYEE